ncbi:unnamed protein product [Dovyalis caffra]|uniref:Uncharacterized protein n=1 Tax=Dovyalis caffra TaxID=77055 RepID=A0AAV1QYI5_9ROSI|nr:unnamed protein product [Dovyalis caffra]
MKWLQCESRNEPVKPLSMPRVCLIIPSLDGEVGILIWVEYKYPGKSQWIANRQFVDRGSVWLRG